MRKRSDNDFIHREVEAGYMTPCHEPLNWREVPYSLTKEGYSRVRRSRDGKPVFVLAHRTRYENTHGPIPSGLVPDHLCRNRWCCNAEHIEAVTPAENLRRGDVAKVSEEQVKQIRSMKFSGMTHAAIGIRFGLSQSHTTNIINGKYWADGPCPAWEIVKQRRMAMN